MERWQHNQPLAPYTTLGIGGNAEYFVTVHHVDELRACIAEARERTLPVTVLGGGSNVLIDDNGVTGLVIRNEICGITHEEVDGMILLTAASGESFDDVVAYAVAKGWWGIENLSAIPGTVGAAPVQNIGAYGVEIASYIESVEVLDTKSDTMTRLIPAECGFGYRDSIFKHEEGASYIVISVTFRLSSESKPQLEYADLAARFKEITPTQQEIRDAVIEIRGGKFPDWHILGTAGSFFKNPIVPTSDYARLLEQYPDMPGYPTEDGRVKIPLGWILDRVCALRGVRDGVVGTYEKQALVLINYGGASSQDVEMFATRVADEVRARTNIAIEWEVTKM